MDTITDVTLVGHRTRSEFSQIWSGIDSLLADWEIRFSVTKSQSEILAMNRHEGRIVTVSPLLSRMLFDAVRYGDSLRGGFDPTVLPLKHLWGLGEQDNADSLRAPPPDSVIAATLLRVGYRKVHVDTLRREVTRQPGIELDVGGIAKGYALREMCAYIAHRGFHNYLVCAGGDVYASGTREDAKPWLIGIQHPRIRDKLLASMRIDSGSIVTSGDYERYRMIGDRRIHHIFDPSTGSPCTNNQSVTIRCIDPVVADILSTGLFCRNADSILAWIESRPGYECVVVDSSGNIHASRGWESSIQWRDTTAIR